MNWLPSAINCFLSQSYRNASLLIVADEDLPQEVMEICGLVAALETANVVTLVGRRGLSIGEKRNFANAHAGGDIICHWDDDDFSASCRISDQVERLESTGKSVTGYRNMRFTNGRNWWTYHGAPGFVLGTSLCYRRDWWQANQFQAVTKYIPEDSNFVYAAQDAGQLDVVDSLDLMHATIHQENTSGRDSLASNYAPCDPPPYWKAVA